MWGNKLLGGGQRSLSAVLVINMRKALFKHGEGQSEEFWMMITAAPAIFRVSIFMDLSGLIKV